MAPLIVLLVSWGLFRAAGALGWKRAASWRSSGVLALGVMFLFTASAHFTPMKTDLAAMVPPPFTGQMWVIYVTGVLEIAGAVGLFIPRFQRLAAYCLIALLVSLFPANAYAALNGIEFQGRAATPLIPRTLMQLFWIAMLWWAAIRKSAPASQPAPASA
jgi:uncharacterized membrane protein